MSTILDALKKSEHERKLNKVPTLADVPTPQETSRWPQMLIILLLFGLLVGVFLLVIQWRNSEPSVQPTPSVMTNEANANEKKAAEIVVNVISFSQTPEQSFVMINGEMVHENEFVRAGLKVEKINPDSVILNHRGQRIEKTP